MKVDEALHMNSGDGDHSYASNSLLQSSVMVKTKPYIEEALRQAFFATKAGKLNIADLGCSCGPSALLAVDMILDAISSINFPQTGDPHPEIHAFLNDLPGNDFNTVFKDIPSFYQKLSERTNGKGRCFISATPGSFYKRLFPSESLHFVYSSNSLHWLSQVPPELTSDEGIVNKGNVFLGRTSPAMVLDSYLAQFRRDFMVFLEARYEEIVPRGCMVLLLTGRTSSDLSDAGSSPTWVTLANAFAHLISEGFVEEEKVDSFNLPLFQPYIEELRAIVQAKGSFDIIQLEEVPYEEHDFVDDKADKSNVIAKTLRAAIKPLLVPHFGEEVMDRLFDKFKELYPQCCATGMITAFVVSLRRRD